MLSSWQLSVLQYHSETGDRIAYYTALAAYGDEYGRLALDVVLNNQLSGAAANSFFLDQSGGVSNDTLATISLKLMQADFAKRAERNGADLTVDDIQTYHREVFDDVAGVSADAWTPNMYLDSFETFAERKAAWEQMLVSYAPASYLDIAERRAEVTFAYLAANAALSVTFVDLCSMDRQQMLDCGVGADFADWFISYSQYLLDLQSAGIGFASPNGPYQVGIPDAGTMIGGNGGDNTLVGTAGDDAMNGQGGDDTFIGGDGADRFHGGSGYDTADYSLDSSGIIIQLGALQGGSADEWAAINEDSVVQRIQDGHGNWDFAIGVEEIIGTADDDRVRLFGSADNFFESEDVDTVVTGGANTDRGDLLDFSGLDSQQGLNIAWSAIDSIEFGRIGAVGGNEAVGFEGVIGTAQGDIIHGDDGGDRINGHLGADLLFGGGADDFIFFDAEDTAVNGGSGRDVAVAIGQDGVTVDMAAQELECVIGCDGADTITVGEVEGGLFAAGSDGSDTFFVKNGEDGYNEGGPRILWGGAGADTFEFEWASYAHGIAVVQIDGLTDETFSSLTLADLGLGSLDLSMFQAIVLNPDQDDRFLYDGDVFTSALYFSDPYGTSSSVRSHASSFITEALGRSLSVQGVYQNNYAIETTPNFEWDEMENIISVSRFTGAFDGFGVGIFDVTDYDPFSVSDQEEAMDLYEYYFTNTDQVVVQVATDPQYNAFGAPLWVVGGTFSGDSLSSNGALTGSLPADPGPSPFDWLLAA